MISSYHKHRRQTDTWQCQVCTPCQRWPQWRGENTDAERDIAPTPLGRRTTTDILQFPHTTGLIQMTVQLLIQV